MGNYYILINSANNPELCLIHWDLLDSNKLIGEDYLFMESQKDHEFRAKTLADMAKIWNDTKFIGHFENESCIRAMKEFSKALVPYNKYPRLYFDFEGFDTLTYIEFIPGMTYLKFGVYNYVNILQPYEYLQSFAETFTEKTEIEAWLNYLQKKQAFLKTLSSSDKGWYITQY